VAGVVGSVPDELTTTGRLLAALQGFYQQAGVVVYFDVDAGGVVPFSREGKTINVTKEGSKMRALKTQKKGEPIGSPFLISIFVLF